MLARLSAGLVLATLCSVFSSPASAQRQLLPNPAVLAGASAELIDRLRADPFTYFRFINRAWTARVCEAFADVTSPTIVRLHGDAHIEQFALTKDAWGLDDFDDSTRGPRLSMLSGSWARSISPAVSAAGRATAMSCGTAFSKGTVWGCPIRVFNRASPTSSVSCDGMRR